MLTQSENDRFTRVGPGTPMGNLLRRYWHPIGCAELVTSKPQRVKLLGEELVLYRGASGRPALMQLRCAHRGLALDHGRVEGDAIRCAYHGWLYDKTGRCIAQPVEPKCDVYKDEFHLKAYRTEEVSGLIFAYMGPEPAPVLPLYDLLRMDRGYKFIQSSKVHANWLQGAENILDVAHFSWLHGFTFPFLAGRKIDYEFRPADYGMDVEVRAEGVLRTVTPYMMPAVNRFSLPGGADSPAVQALVFRVPSDDTSHEAYFLGHIAGNDPVTVSAGRVESALGEYKPLAADWWGVDLTDQDRMAVEQQGPITDRTTEHLVASDVGIVRMRRILREAVETVERGEDPIGIIRDPAKQNVELAFMEEFTLPNAGEKADDYSAVLFARSSPAA